jgi:sec-independent protein translocase protein TatA
MIKDTLAQFSIMCLCNLISAAVAFNFFFTWCAILWFITDSLIKEGTAMGTFSVWHLMILLVVVLIIFGAGKLPEVGQALGKGIKNFKSAMSEEEKNLKNNIDDKNKPSN